MLQRFNKTRTFLQEVDLDLCNAVGLVASLRDYVAGLRGQFERFETTAKSMSPSVSQTYKSESQRSRQRKKHADESSEPDSHLSMSSQQKFAVSVFTLIVDKLVAELDRRYESYKEINNCFGFLNNIHSLSSQELRSSAINLQGKYNTDLQEDFEDEMAHFKEYCKNEPNNSARELLQIIRKSNLQYVFPNLDIALRIYLTFPVTNASGER